MKQIFVLITIIFLFQNLNAGNHFKNQSVLVTGKWIRVSVKDEGICKITYSQLVNWGINTPENVAVFSNGGYMLPKMNSQNYPDDLEKIPVFHATDQSGNKAIYFYSTGTIQWNFNQDKGKYEHTSNSFSNKTYFYISSDLPKSGNPVSKAVVNQNPSITLSSFDEHLLYEKENINLIKSGRRFYSDELMKAFTKNYVFESVNVDAAQQATLTVAAAAGSTSKSYHVIEANDRFVANQEYPKISTSGLTTNKANRRELDYQITTGTTLNIALTYQVEGSMGQSWLDFLTLNQTARLSKTEKPLIFSNQKALQNEIVRYSIQAANANYQLWDISTPLQPAAVTYTQNNGQLIFNDQGGKISNYVLFNPLTDQFLTASFENEVANQNIHGLPMYDFVIVSHPNFLSASERLAEHHRQQDDMRVLVVTTDEVYNEFSSGIADVGGIRNMIRMFYTRKTSSDSLRYVLLMGDGSYINHQWGDNIHNYIPTYQSVNSENDDSFLSDDFFVLLDENEGESTGLIDIGIGRIPCRTLKEADLVVDKSIQYSNPEAMGDWRNVIAFIADDEDSNVHMSDTEKLIELVNSNYPGFYTDKIYFDAFNQIQSSSGERYPDATAAINQRVEDGALILNYVGHANTQSLSHEDVLGISDINSWSNQKKLPVFVTATCEFSRFDDDNTSAGEQILLNPAGGGVALFSTTRVVYSSENYILNRNFYHSVFMQDNNGENYRLGDIMRKAKNMTSNSRENKRNFSLLGNPALKLAFPKFNVQTLSINSQLVTDSISLGALDKVSIEGHVCDHLGQILENFNGTVDATVYDKEINVQTLANNGGRKFEFKTQNNIIYKGTASVENGKFSFSFIIPKDISYNIDKGKILYYASNAVDDGNGATTSFYIGGSSSNPFVDDNPPEIDMFLNNKHFRNNDRVSSSALLLVNLFDESGINTVGTGIGHDIVAILDNDYSKPMILNDFYRSELNSYQNGTITYPLNNLSPGEHTLSIKVWDVQNNSANSEISFIVEEGFEITAVSNYPNPVTFNTTFVIQHNLPGDIFDTKVEIFNLRGVKIYEINETTGSYGSVETNVRWDITDTFFPIGNEKLLVYRVTMKNLEGLQATGAGKFTLMQN
ncbi:MAG: type IX secretion system sortase PorU [Prolixibacteraceae bacterium]|nr:type IX secretion system sortase PorU [Prolixibacteraceae bacterium]